MWDEFLGDNEFTSKKWDNLISGSPFNRCQKPTEAAVKLIKELKSDQTKP
jgi:hypothetical protein